MGNRIREMREDRGLSQERLGEMIGHNKNYISRLEKQSRRFRVDQLYRLADALECHPAELLDDSVALRADEAEIIGRFRGLGERDKGIAYRMIESLDQPTPDDNDRDA